MDPPASIRRALAMDAGPPRGLPQQRAYVQVALYACGNALAAVIGLLLWNLYGVLADYRDAAVYALLCSVALRGPKSWLVGYLEHELKRRTIFRSFLSLLSLPLSPFVEAWEDTRAIVIRWQQLAVEAHRRARRPSATAEQPPTSPRTPTAALATSANSVLGSVATLRTLPTLKLFAEAGVRALRSRPLPRRRPKRSSRADPARRPTRGTSATMFHWLFAACIAWLVRVWVRQTWSTTVQVAILGTTVILGAGFLFGILFGLKWYLRRAMAMSPIKAPFGAGAADLAEEDRRLLERLRASSKEGRALSSPRKRSAGASKKAGGLSVRPPAAATAADERSPPPQPRHWRAAAGSALAPAGRLYLRSETSLRASLRRNLHPIVAGTLITALVLGSLCLTGLLAVRVAQEGRGLAISARRAFPAVAWSGGGLRGAWLLPLDDAANGPTVPRIDASAPGADSVACPDAGGAGGAAVRPEALNSTCEMAPAAHSETGSCLETAASSASRRTCAAEGPPPNVRGSGVPRWVQKQGAEALVLAQRALPSLAGWLEDTVSRFVAQQNLTDALDDARMAYEVVQGPRRCSRRERADLVIRLAGAQVARDEARAAEARLDAQLVDLESRLFADVGALTASMARPQASRGGDRPGAAPEAADAASDGASPSAAHVADSRAPSDAPSPSAAAYRTGGSTGPRPDGDAVTNAARRRLLALDADASQARAAHAAAVKALVAAEHDVDQASMRLGLCLSPEDGTGAGDSSPPGDESASTLLASEVTPRLRAAYRHLWHGRPVDAARELRLAGTGAASALSRAAAAADSNTLPRLATAALAPLGIVARVAVGSVGSTAATAVMGGLGVLRLGVGLVKAAIQATLFLALLYYLLATPKDPIAQALGILPLSDAGRSRAALELNQALSGVLMASVKLMAFHGLFTWLTFRVYELPLAYTASVLAAVCGLLPFVPTYAVALPASALLAGQGRYSASLIVFVLHWAAYYFGDTAILEDIPGAHPYLLSLGILGGIWTFDNPLQGCLLGPIFLSLLSAFYRLHGEFMGFWAADGDIEAELGAARTPVRGRRPSPSRPLADSVTPFVTRGGALGSGRPERGGDGPTTLRGGGTAEDDCPRGPGTALSESRQGSMRKSMSDVCLSRSRSEEDVHTADSRGPGNGLAQTPPMFVKCHPHVD